MQDFIDYQIEDRCKRDPGTFQSFYNGGINVDVFCCVGGLERKPVKERRPPKFNLGTWDFCDGGPILL
jgi:hypothetical protein